ncbi:MAG: ISAs1 family transposase [Ruminococcus sp.]|nr:ISAs1 family transposase [Ruminococcus sp.]MCR5542028.1 ISAs1 family transposase [Ruminococcus sp.]
MRRRRFCRYGDFSKSRQEYLSKFLELPNCISDSDTFRRVFEKLDPSELSSCLINWISEKRTKRGTVAIDRKTICGSGNDKHKAYHVISAFVAENQLTLGELAVEEKTNEITAVPELLDLVDIKGDIVTADAMSFQKKIVEKIIKKNADSAIGLTQNQPALYKDTKDYFIWIFC